MAGVIGFGLAWRTGQVLNRYRYIMSARTYQLHKSSLITLTTQVSGPTLVLGIPVFVVYVIVASQMTQLHDLAATAPFFISAHSAVTTSCLIMTTANYKNLFTKNYDNVRKKMKCKRTPTASVMSSPVAVMRPMASVVNTFF
ncbi:G protein-coupled receptor [Caenorhabditis elegans]|nr:G protein-coupled receptor [Caenorhabditis elegans]CTQ86750.1 G protein-coupled receptor [Caenorhabditis elegans]|eukprot:NP_001300051.1 Serpentine Receptor, class I [Caenorhabditis elegans]